jgi:uncharacterized protein YndB with AHSA1/START domain
MSRNETKLELRGDREIVITHTVNAPARIVFDAWTKPEFVKRWWAPKSRGVTLFGCDGDVREGGTYRYVMRRDNGQEMAFSGRYAELTPHSRLAYTQVFEPMRHMGETFVTVTFDQVAGRTTITSVERYPSAEVRAAVLATGMEKGMRESMQQLEALVAELS